MDAKTLKEISVLVDIREIMGDPKGKLMQSELIEEIRKLKESTQWQPIFKKTASFRCLALGARFKYLETEGIWVKLSRDGTIAEWDEEKATDGWLSQSICAFDEDDDFDKPVLVETLSKS